MPAVGLAAVVVLSATSCSEDDAAEDEARKAPSVVATMTPDSCAKLKGIASQFFGAVAEPNYRSASDRYGPDGTGAECGYHRTGALGGIDRTFTLTAESPQRYSDFETFYLDGPWRDDRDYIFEVPPFGGFSYAALRGRDPEIYDTADAVTFVDVSDSNGILACEATGDPIGLDGEEQELAQILCRDAIDLLRELAQQEADGATAPAPG